MGDTRDDLSREQAERIMREIESLRSGHQGMFQRKYREFFAHAKEIGQLFKDSRALTPPERQRLWATFSSLCDDVRAEQERNNESARNNSRLKKELIESHIREAYHWAKGSDSFSDVREAERRLTQITERLKDGWHGFTGSTGFFEELSGNDGRLTKEDRDYLWDKWREAKEAARERRAWLAELHYDHMRDIASECLQIAESDPRAAKNKIKQAHIELKTGSLEKHQFSEIHRLLDEAWETASQASRDKHAEWCSRLENHLERWAEVRDRKEATIEKIENEIEECEEMETNARSEEFAERVRGWIEEKREKIRELQQQIEELEEKISSAKDDLAN